MRRAVLWGVGAGVLAILLWVVEARSFFRPLLAVAPVVVYAVVLLVRVVMEPRGERPAMIPLGAVRRAPREGTATMAAPRDERDSRADDLEDALGSVQPD